MKTKHFLSMICAAALAIQISAQTVFAADCHYALTSDESTTLVNLEEDYTLHCKFMILEDIGTAAIQATIKADEPLSISNLHYSDPYCYGDGDYTHAASRIINKEDNRIVWLSSQNGGLENEILSDPTLPFAEFDVTIPADTPEGNYSIHFFQDMIQYETIVTSGCKTTGIGENGIDLLTLEVEYDNLNILIRRYPFEGTCGENATYTMSEDGVLHIEGSGIVESEDFIGREDIQSVVIGEGITALSDTLFQDCMNLTSVILPDSMDSLGEHTFENHSEALVIQGLPKVVIPYGTKYGIVVDAGDFLLGDGNLDGLVDSDDAVMCLKQANADMLGEELYDSDTCFALDFNMDGIVDSDDCASIIKYANSQMMLAF